MKRISVFGAGMVGTTIASDLASSGHQVTSLDLDSKALKKVTERAPSIKTLQVDLSDQKKVETHLDEIDLAVNATPGFLGYRTLELLIRAGKNVVDISFFPEDPLELDELAREKGVTVIMDCGIAPGMDNIILGHYDSQMTVDYFECLVGGLPKIRKYPFEYKAPFSPVDVIEEYIRPARLKEHGKVVTKPALTEPEMVEFEQVGTLEAFNTDGLRSILDTLPHIPDMKEKTLRFPGHIDLIKAMKAAGFLDEENLPHTAEILKKQWKLEPGESEFTIMRVTIKGEGKEVVYDLYDEYDETTDISSMSRTTGFTCTGGVEALIQGKFNKKGVFPPELVGKEEGMLDFFLQHLNQRGVKFKMK